MHLRLPLIDESNSLLSLFCQSSLSDVLELTLRTSVGQLRRLFRLNSHRYMGKLRRVTYRQRVGLIVDLKRLGTAPGITLAASFGFTKPLVPEIRNSQALAKNKLKAGRFLSAQLTISLTFFARQR